ncbi:hypothetical protein BS50DRAFT_580584 [Corynespora cassiicola Philippines]|uniref:Uncharacterized protein n=1 Tax=Corynespora cassiicola Philippines TaxID=1448308 RepID=A0A2T2MZK9_CORCC|nr:hypothetical protein BS50DRAFT_580584 [Corynespora cassiicola Philippines]
MSIPQASVTQNQDITPPSSFSKPPLTPPPTDEKQFAQAYRVLALFREIRTGKHTKRDPWIVFQFVEGEYDELERQLQKDDDLLRFAKNKIRYDYNGNTHCLVVRMPTAIHELFIARIENAIFSQLELIGEGSGDVAAFARKVQPARSTEIFFPTDDTISNKQSKYEPDTSFWHDDAQYPGVIIEIAYSQKKKALDRLAEDYLLDSDASVKAVIGLDIEYGRRDSRKATLSVWRSRLIHTDNGDELQVAKEVDEQAFRDEQGNLSHHAGIRLQLSDFACDELSTGIINRDAPEIRITTQQLCQYLAIAESKMRGQRPLVRNSIPPGVKKRKRSVTPPEKMASDDEARYAELEERDAKRMLKDDPDYENI